MPEPPSGIIPVPEPPSGIIPVPAPPSGIIPVRLGPLASGPDDGVAVYRGGGERADGVSPAADLSAIVRRERELKGQLGKGVLVWVCVDGVRDTIYVEVYHCIPAPMECRRGPI